MNAGQWSQVDKIFSEALNREPDERARFIDEACAGDVSLRNEVKTLIAAHEKAGSFLESGDAGVLSTPGASGASIAIGTRLGPYEILSVIGAGGMGEVYKAHDARLRRDVAVKVLQRLTSDGAAWERFQREARAASALSHPNICTVYDVGEADGQPYLVMELLEGITLSAHIEGKELETEAVLAIAVQIAEALEAAHAKGIIHRDIKAANVMIVGPRRVKVLDFGLAKQTAVGEHGHALTHDAVTIVGTVMGTPPYLSPEVLQGAAADARSDLWAFGVLLYQMLSGRLPFTGATVYEMGSAILRNRPPPLPANVPTALRAIVDRCLAKQPKDRYQTAGEVRSSLEELQTTAVTASGVNKRMWLWGAGLAAVLLIGMSLSRPQPQPEPTPVIAAVPAPALEPVRVTSTGGPQSPNDEANDLFELAMTLERVQSNIPEAQATLARALKLDPNFAEARRYHAFQYVILLLNGYSNDSTILYKADEELSQLAREVPDLKSLPSAQTALYMAQGRKELIPIENLNRVIAESPTVLPNRNWRMIMNVFAENNEEAKREADEMLDEERNFAAPRLYLGDIYRREGDISSAIREQARILKVSKANVAAIRYLTLAYMDSGELGQARRVLDDGLDRVHGNFILRLTSALLLAVEGKRADALKAMDEDTKKFAAAAFTVTLDAAEFYAELGDTDEAIKWLQLAVKNGDERANWFERNPRLAKIRKDETFLRIVESIKNRRTP